MRNSITDRLYKNNVFIVGDGAHQFPPSGGYGLNTGIFDAINLYWRLIMILKCKGLKKEQINKLKSSFENECKINSKVNMLYKI
jgi:2-polyprenyl-6-methoxyphenol hydroxylase-like FAD-dependent oxidoreductase